MAAVVNIRNNSIIWACKRKTKKLESKIKSELQIHACSWTDQSIVAKNVRFIQLQNTTAQILAKEQFLKTLANDEAAYLA